MESRKTVRELPAPISFLIERIRERAGLFAWRETVQTFSAWDRHSLEALAGQAWRHTPVVEIDGADPDFDQFAVYDPEFRQWHVVSANQVMNDCMPLSC
ncbi:hypothetical protein [Paraburkholderia acidiphila]|uniref:hypothetical protein n=1 Tax=Paraburkholderia acidiphila TaxID=2571747 RepID=UPI001E2D1D6F|nr:hypothetical protein [Paraburkholderia acidiphila]